MWTENRTGPNSIAAGNAAAWLPFPVISSRSEEIASNLSAQDHAAQLAPETDPTVVAGYEAQMESYAAALRSDKTAFFGSVIIPGRGSGNLIDLHPLSRGTVNIDITDPEGKEPVVDYRALSNPLDTAVLADLIRFARRYYFNNTVNAQFDPREMRPGESLTSDSDLAGYITTTLSPSEFHPVGTCAMMPREMGGVVNEKLKVYGVDRLRVVDGSMMPTLPGANTCQTVYAVAEKVSRFVEQCSMLADEVVLTCELIVGCRPDQNGCEVCNATESGAKRHASALPASQPCRINWLQEDILWGIHSLTS